MIIMPYWSVFFSFLLRVLSILTAGCLLFARGPAAPSMAPAQELVLRSWKDDMPWKQFTATFSQKTP